MPTTTQTRKIVISVDASGATGLKDLADKLGGVGRNTKQLADGFSKLGDMVKGYLGFLGARELAGFSDEIQNLNSRLLTMSGTQEGATVTLNALVGVARETNQSLEGISESYFRMSQALKDVGVSQQTMIEMTRTIANTFRLSGASTEEAKNATIQLGQAFSLGVLRGQDLRSVMSQNVVLTRLLRKEFGNDLLKQAEKGMITVSKIMEVLNKNMKDVDGQAKVMSATFGQSFTKALDAVKLKTYELADALGGPQGVSTAVSFFIKHLDDFVVVGSVLALGTIPAMISGIKALGATLLTLNPYVLVVGIEALVLYFASGAKNAKDFFLLLELGFTDIEASVDRAIAKFYELRASIAIAQSTKDEMTKIAATYRNAATDHEVHAKALIIEAQAQAELDKITLKAGDSAKRWAKDIAAARKLEADSDPKKMLAELNASYKSGAIDASEYNKRILDFDLKKAQYQFKEGKINLDQLNEAIRKVDLNKLERQFLQGSISVDQFMRASRDVDLAKMNDQLSQGKINIEEFNTKLAALTNDFSANAAGRTGITDYLKSIGTTTQQVAGAIKNTFSGLEDVIFDFTKTGEANFNKFTQAVMDDLLRIIIRSQIIAPLAQGLLNYISTPSTSSATQLPASNANYSTTAAMGKAFSGGNVIPFATGGIVSGPTNFGFGKGKTGLMGEAGPEAILPLQRGKGGSLGVAASITPVTINVINQSGNEVKQTETTGPSGEKQIEILITSKVREGIAAGSYDKSMKSAYGLSRRGS